jgi:hypothetical protein
MYIIFQDAEITSESSHGVVDCEEYRNRIDPLDNKAVGI